MGMAAGITWLSCIRADIKLIFYLLPVNGRHLRFVTHADTAQCSHQSLCVPRPQKCQYGLGFPLIPCIKAETKVFHTCFWFIAAILISGLDTVINCTSSKSNSDALPFSENCIKKCLPFQRYWREASEAFGTNVKKKTAAAKG